MSPAGSPSFIDVLRAHRMRIGASVIAVATVAGVTLASDSAVLVLLVIPLVIGCVPQVVASDAFSTWIDRRQAAFQRLAARGKAGAWFGRYFLRPLGEGSSALWDRTAGIQSQHIRAGVRLLVVAYFWTIMIALLAAAVYVIIGVVIAILALVAVFWMLGQMLGGGSTSVTRSRVRSAWDPTRSDDDVADQVGLKGKRVYSGTNWFTEELQGRIDDEGNIYRGTNWLNEEKIGRIDGDGTIYKGTTWLNEEKVGRISEDGTVYKGSNWFAEEKTGRIDADGAIYKGTNWFNEEKRGRTSE